MIRYPRWSPAPFVRGPAAFAPTVRALSQAAPVAAVPGPGPFDSAPVSFAVNAAAAVLSFAAGRTLNGVWSTIGYMAAGVAGLRAANEFSRITQGM